MASVSKKLMVMIAVSVGIWALGEGENGLTQKCSPTIQALTGCLTFVTGKGPSPTKECCSGISDMKNKQPVCLCFFIGQAHNGSESIKSLGIQEPKLLQLPSACHLLNASVTNCPGLLGISPSSPAASIFMHNNATSPSTAMSSSSSSSSSDKSNAGLKHRNGALGDLVAVFALAKLLAF